MKHQAIIIAAASLLLASCTAHYVATDRVTRHLDGSRSIFTSCSDTSLFKGWREDTLATPLPFDFRSEKDTMRYSYTIDIINGGWSVKHDSMPKILQPEVTVEKSFRWFTTRYSYTARFPQLDSLPVPISDYLTDDEQRLLFTPNELPADWTGTDLYSMLDKLNTKYVKWWDHCLFEKEMETYSALCDSTQRALLTQYHDTLLALILADLPNERKSFGNVAQNFPELDFIGDLDRNDNTLSWTASFWAYEHWNLDAQVLWRVVLPGDHMVEHMVSADRMIMGDYVIEEYADVVNWWACALTLLLLVGGSLLIGRKISRNQSL
jgi:hypothetical protein